MHMRAIAASTAALSGLFLVASPAFADSEYVGVPVSIDWRLVVILTVLALAGFYYVLEGMNPDR